MVLGARASPHAYCLDPAPLPTYLEEIAELSRELEELHGLSAGYDTDVQELKLREQRMAKVVPAVNSLACWLKKDIDILFEIQAASIR